MVFILLIAAMLGFMPLATGIIPPLELANFKKTAIQTEAVVTEVQSTRIGSDDDGDNVYEYTVYVEFYLDDIRYTADFDVYTNQFGEGQTVSIYYNQDTPQNIRVDVSAFNYITNIIIGAVFTIIGLVGLIKTGRVIKRIKQEM